MIDSKGFRASVGIVLCNNLGQLFWARRIGQNAWQFPQGGIKPSETPEIAMYRELREETGLLPEHVSILSCTNDWLKYYLPKHCIKYDSKPLCIGQKQIWYLLGLKANDDLVNLEYSDEPEFDCWEWLDYRFPVAQVIDFKRNVYAEVLRAFMPLLFTDLNDG